MPSNPKWPPPSENASSGSKPCPSSATSKLTHRGSSASRIRTLPACECFTVLVTASCAIRNKCCSISSGSSRERRSQVLAFERGGAQIHHRSASFGKAMPRHLASQLQVFPSQVHAATQGNRHSVELRRNPDESLRQRIVNLPRQPRAFFQHEGEALPNLVNAQLIQAPHRCRERRQAQASEPRGFVIVRQQLKTELGFACEATRNYRPHYKPVTAVRQAVVVGDAPRRGPDPIAVQAFQPVGVEHSLGGAQIDAGITELYTAIAGGQIGRFIQSRGLAVNLHIGQMHHRGRQTRWRLI